MGRETGDDESKKECPSCGLGVPVEANICEFCGWDFEEEDEWILQIEKLERDLLLEKQRFEPGTVDQKIESTLRNPIQERVEAEKAGLTRREPEPQEPERPQVVRVAEQMIDREAPEPARAAPARAPPPARAPEPAPVQPAPSEAPQPKVRKVREVKAPPPAPAIQSPPQPPQQQPTGQSRQLRKVKAPPPAQPAEQPEEQPQTRKAMATRKVKG
jgi:hypothetical protein